MKSSYIPTSLIIIFLISFSFCFAQTKDYPVQISLGVNVIDVYPTGVSSQGGLFEDFFNIQDHWNFGSVPLMVQVTKYLRDPATGVSSPASRSCLRFDCFVCLAGDFLMPPAESRSHGSRLPDWPCL